jgi:hypothetical protein
MKGYDSRFTSIESGAYIENRFDDKLSVRFQPIKVSAESAMILSKSFPKSPILGIVFSILHAMNAGAEKQVFEDFSKDPGWEAVNNRIDPSHTRTTVQDFGYGPASNHAGGTGPGEIGGRISRSLTRAYYAKVIQPQTLRNRLTASGRFAVPAAEGGSAMLFGWFNSRSDGWRTPNSLALRLDGNGGKYWVFFEYGTREYGTGGGETFEGDRYQTTPTPPEKADGTVHEWALDYDPEGAEGRGGITFTFDGETFTAPLAEGHKEQGAVFDRFGILNQMTSGSHMDVYFDDLVLGDAKEDFSKDPGWAEEGNQVTFKDRAVRPYHDFGYSETDHAGGAKGELGGIVWRIESNSPGDAGYYGVPVEKLSLDRELVASGKVAMLRGGADSAALIGWFNSKSFREGPVPKNFLGIMVEGPSRVGHYFRPAYSNAKSDQACPAQGPVIRPDGSQHEWTLRYDPQGAQGRGSIEAVLDGEPISLALQPGVRAGGADFDRFGMLSFLQGGNHVVIYFDDLTYTTGIGD